MYITVFPHHEGEKKKHMSIVLKQCGVFGLVFPSVFNINPILGCIYFRTSRFSLIFAVCHLIKRLKGTVWHFGEMTFFSCLCLATLSYDVMSVFSFNSPRKQSDSPKCQTVLYKNFFVKVVIDANGRNMTALLLKCFWALTHVESSWCLSVCWRKFVQLKVHPRPSPRECIYDNCCSWSRKALSSIWTVWL